MEGMIEFLKGGAQKTNTQPNLPKQLYQSFKFSKANFQQLKRQPLGEAVFIDGGNAELFSTPTFSVNFIRLVGVKFKDKKRLSVHSKEFMCAVKAIGEENISFVARPFMAKGSLPFSELMFDSYDKSIRTGSNRVSISKIAGVVRRLCEIHMATELASGLVVLDGNLEANYTYEKEFFEELYKKSALVVGFAKTSTLLMDGGMGLLQFINFNSPKGSWMYHPIARSLNERHQAEICVAKLNKNASHVFRVDFHGRGFVPVLERLASVSIDACTLGYPYPLVFTDRMARVSTEKAYLKTKLLSLLPKELQKAGRALDFHDTLNLL